MEYPKINTLWKRDDNYRIIEGDYSCTEFASQKKWRVQEKIDGTNVRIYIYNFDEEHKTKTKGTHKNENKIYNSSCDIEMYGRTSKANLPDKLIKWFQETELEKKLEKLPTFCNDWPMILYGEGFGTGIQSGGIYRKDISFILFDVYMNGRWSTREEVKIFSEVFEFETPHDFGFLTVNEIIEFVKSRPVGRYNRMSYEMEGVIARSEPLVRFNTISADPVMFKLKVRDFKN